MVFIIVIYFYIDLYMFKHVKRSLLFKIDYIYIYIYVL